MEQAVSEATARKLRETIDAGLVSGLGKPEPGKMCIEAAINYATGRPHGDKPTCVAPAVRDFGITLNDSGWSSDAARAKGMRRFGVAQLGSAGVVDDEAFAKLLAEGIIRRIVPLALRSAAKLNPAHAGALEAAAVRCEQDGAARAARAAAYAARAAADAADAAAYAADAAADAARSAADAARSAYAARAAADDALQASAEIAVDALIALNSPGAAWLQVCDEVAA